MEISHEMLININIILEFQLFALFYKNSRMPLFSEYFVFVFSLGCSTVHNKQVSDGMLLSVVATAQLILSIVNTNSLSANATVKRNKMRTRLWSKTNSVPQR